MKEMVEALYKFTEATRALKEIRDTQGKVCSNFGLCHHKSCQSSYTSWVIADVTLKKISE